MPRVSAVILLGGSGVRFGSSTPKQFHRLSGKKVYLHTVDAFLRSNLFDEVILVAPEKWMREVRLEAPRCKVVAGGATRQESSRLGVLACSRESQYVVIHDGVRPFVSDVILKENIASVIQFGAVDTCLSSSDTIVIHEDGKIKSIPDRRLCMQGQTPQSFAKHVILAAHEEAVKNGIHEATDDCQLVVKMGHPVAIVPGDQKNIKITSELDLLISEQIFRLFDESGKMERTLSGHFVVIGGRGGIGSAIAFELESLQCTVTSLSREECDLLNPYEIERAALEIYEKYGPVDGVIHAAGVCYAKNTRDLTDAQVEEMVQVNVCGAVASARKFVVKEGGHHLFIASSSYFRGREGLAVYGATKAALVNFAQGFAEENRHLCVHVIVPERTDTPLRKRNFVDGGDGEPKFLLDPKFVARKAVAVLQSGVGRAELTTIRVLDQNSSLISQA